MNPTTPTQKDFKQKLIYKMSPTQIQLVMLSYRLSKYGHKGQTRDDGTTRYFEHPKRVALILLDELRIYDYEMIIVALLHDIKEDAFILDWEDIDLIFGKRVLGLIKLLTKETKETKYIENLKQSGQDAQIIKLADRLDNMRDLHGCRKEKIQKLIRETQKHFIPWAKEVNQYLFSELQLVLERR